MKYHILHDFGSSTPFKEKSSDRSKDLYKLKLLTNFDIKMTSLLGGVLNNVLNFQFVEVRLTKEASNFSYVTFYTCTKMILL